MVVKFTSNGDKKRGTGATGCTVTCIEATTITPRPTTPTTTANNCTMIWYQKEKVKEKVKKVSDCSSKCNKEPTCKYFEYTAPNKVSIFCRK